MLVLAAGAWSPSTLGVVSPRQAWCGTVGIGECCFEHVPQSLSDPWSSSGSCCSGWPEGEVAVRRIRDRVAGLDVHRDSVTACVQLFEDARLIGRLMVSDREPV